MTRGQWLDTGWELDFYVVEERQGWEVRDAEVSLVAGNLTAPQARFLCAALNAAGEAAEKFYTDTDD